MFNTSYSPDFPSYNTKSGMLYSKLETSVIATFNPSGNLKPLYFEYKDLCGDNHHIKIDEVLSTKEENFAGLPAIIYSCIAIIEDKRLPCRLRYHVMDHYWELMY